MRKILVLTAVLAGLSAGARADLLEVSAFGGYTSVGMKDVNDKISSIQNISTNTPFGSGYIAGLDVRTGVIIPVPFMEIGPRLEYIGTNTAEAAFSISGKPVDVKEDASLTNVLLGLNVNVDLPLTGLGLGIGAYGGYGYGVIRQGVTTALSGPNLPFNDLYTGGGFVGELEGRLSYKLFSIVHLYGFGGMRFANLGQFTDAAASSQTFLNFNGGAPSVDFTGVNGGGGLNLDF